MNHNLPTPFHQEMTEGHRVLCASVVLDKPHEPLLQRVANRVYEDSRAQRLKICGFPDYGPVIAALKDANNCESNKEFEVTTKKHDRLVILQSLAAKWLETSFKAEVLEAIEAHNVKFNPDGEYWHESNDRLVGLRKKWWIS